MNNLKLGSVGILISLWISSASAAPVPAPSNMRLLETTTSFASQMAMELPEQVHLVGEVVSGTSLILVQQDAVEKLSQRSHKITGRCGGFIDITDESNEARIASDDDEPDHRLPPLPTLNQKKQEIARGVSEINGKNIESFVKAYSGTFRTRNAKSEDGAKAPAWLKAQWTKMAEKAGRDDIRIDLLPPPSGFSQPNIRITIPGESQDVPVVIIGAHLDSINQQDSGGDAPGSDDDASGIGAVTEIYRVLLARKIHPKAKIQIFGYAAEEFGLYGSRSVAEKYQSQKAQVLGVMQLDMVAYGANTHKMTFITDYTDKQLSLWAEQVYGMYVGAEVQHDRCGYACSDHASWTRYGFKSVMPFETTLHDDNPRIHSSHDVWDEKLDSEYAALFAKLGYAFVAELARVR